jgi:hypothetical protein
VVYDQHHEEIHGFKIDVNLNLPRDHVMQELTRKE